VPSSRQTKTGSERLERRKTTAAQAALLPELRQRLQALSEAVAHAEGHARACAEVHAANAAHDIAQRTLDRAQSAIADARSGSPPRRESKPPPRPTGTRPRTDCAWPRPLWQRHAGSPGAGVARPAAQWNVVSRVRPARAATPLPLDPPDLDLARQAARLRSPRRPNAGAAREVTAGTLAAAREQGILCEERLRGAETGLVLARERLERADAERQRLQAQLAALGCEARGESHAAERLRLATEADAIEVGLRQSSDAVTHAEARALEAGRIEAEARRALEDATSRSAREAGG